MFVRGRVMVLVIAALLALIVFVAFGDGLVAACGMHQQIRGVSGCV